MISGAYNVADLESLIQKNGGTAELPTVAGPDLKFSMASDGNVAVMDDKGDAAEITISDVHQSNGVIHVIDKVLLP